MSVVALASAAVVIAALALLVWLAARDFLAITAFGLVYLFVRSVFVVGVVLKSITGGFDSPKRE